MSDEIKEIFKEAQNKAGYQNRWFKDDIENRVGGLYHLQAKKEKREHAKRVSK